MELPTGRSGTSSVTPMRRTLAVRASTILLIVLALLARSAGAAMPPSSGGGAAALATGASSVDRARGLSGEPHDATRLAFVRPASRSITRSHAPIAGRDGDGRGIVALGVPSPHLERVALRLPASVAARRHGVTSPGQPAPASRAPPVG